METFIAVVVVGLLVGCLYALVSTGLTLTYGVLRVVNFAHGEFLMVGMYVTYLLQAKLNLDPYVSWPISTVVVVILSIVTFIFVIERTIQSAHAVQAFVTLGLSLVLQNLALFLFTGHIVTTSTFVGQGSILIGPIRLPDVYVISAAAALAITFGIWLWLQKTDFGKAVRAIAQNTTAAQLQGINHRRVYMFTFALGTGLAGLGGALYSPISATYPTVGFGMMLVAFVIVVLGGMGSIQGALIAALIIGAVESLSSYYLGQNARQIAYFAIFVAALVIRPSGLLGIRGAELIGYR